MLCYGLAHEEKTKANTMKFDQQAIQSLWLLTRSLMHRLRGNSLLRNSMYIVGTGAATSLFGFFFWILAAHTYSTYDVGLGSTLISVMTLASVLANLGMGSTLVQTLPGRETGRAWSLTLNAGLATGIVAGLLAGVIVVVTLPLISHQFALVNHQAIYAFAFVAGVPLMTVSTLLDQAFIAERTANNMLVRNAAVSILKIPLLVLPVVLLTRVGAWGIVLASVVAIAIVLIGALLLLLPRLGRGYCLVARGITGQVRSMLSSLTGHYFINLGGLSIQYLLPVVVSIRLSPTDNAYYYTTARVSDFLLSVSAAVALSLFAEGSHAADELPRKVRSSAKILAMVLGPAMLACFFGGRYFLLVFGPNYAQHGQLLLKIEAISAVPDAITNVYISVLRVQRRLRFAALLNLSMAALILALSWVLLPALGIAGQGWAYLIAQVAGSLVAGIDILHARRHRRWTVDRPFRGLQAARRRKVHASTDKETTQGG